tara:strand:+ start:158 stop:934 length:777 start_codon:yes stop_codon:yes gene_type:complete
MNNKIAVLVLSCDSYKDLWDPFFYFFNKNWADCNLDKYIITNFEKINKNNFKSINVHKDFSWSSSLRKGLAQLNNYDYVFLFLEDLMISEKVNNNRILKLIDSFVKDDGNFLTFVNEPPPDKKYNNFYGLISPGSLYRPTATFSLWKKETLLELLIDEENAWEFERKGSVRSDNYQNFFSVYESDFKFINTVIKGKWVPSALKKVKRLGFDIKTGNRKSFKTHQFYLYLIYIYTRNLSMKLIPKKIKRQLADFRKYFR